MLVTDNGHEFAQFARDYDFKHTTSSPRYPCSNGEAEWTVRTVKSLLEKEADFHKALLAYRGHPIGSWELSSTTIDGEENQDTSSSVATPVTTAMA